MVVRAVCTLPGSAVLMLFTGVEYGFHGEFLLSDCEGMSLRRLVG